MLAALWAGFTSAKEKGVVPTGAVEPHRDIIADGTGLAGYHRPGRGGGAGLETLFSIG